MLGAHSLTRKYSSIHRPKAGGLPALSANTFNMILTPLAMRRGSQGLTLGDQVQSSISRTPSKRGQQLEVPRLDLRVLDQDKKEDEPRHHPRISVSSVESPKTDDTTGGPPPLSGDVLIKPESSVSEEKEEGEEVAKSGVAKWISRLRLFVPHVLLATVVILYTIIGAAVFYIIERSNEIEYKTQIVEKVRNLRDEYLNKMWNLSQEGAIGDEQFFEQSIIELAAVLNETMKAFEEGVTDNDINQESLGLTWTYSEAVLFSATVITTIGYGNLVPKTFLGRLFCIIYALLGIPLTLITIADIGKFVGSLITWAFERLVLAKEMAMDGFRYILDRLHPGRRKSRQTSLLLNRRRRSSAWTKDSTRRRSSEGTIGSRQSRRKSTASQCKSNNVDGTEEDIKQEENKNQSEKPSGTEEDEDEEEEDEEEAVSDIPVPPSFILLIVVGYTAISSFLFSNWEDWLYLDAFYFCLITVTTVGFGDLVPSEDSNAIFVLVFIFLGLILATMCIDMVGTHYITRMHYMGRKLKDAQAALAMIGGKAVNMTAWTKQLKRMQKQYGMTDEQMRRLMENPEEYVQLMEAARLGLKARESLRAFIPKEAARMRYIDQNGGTISEYTPTTPSQAAELLAMSTPASSVLTQITISNA